MKKEQGHKKGQKNNRLSDEDYYEQKRKELQRYINQSVIKRISFEVYEKEPHERTRLNNAKSYHRSIQLKTNPNWTKRNHVFEKTIVL